MEGQQSSSLRTVLFWVVVVAVSSSVVAVSGQGACINDLAVCLNAISNSSVKPSSECCNSLKKAVKTDLTCLCSLYGNADFFKGANINRTRAFEIPRLCAVSDDFSQCGSNAAPPASASAPPQATRSSPPPPNSGSEGFHGSVKLAWGTRLYWALGLLCASVALVGL